jgi:hypothetical protein
MKNLLKLSALAAVLVASATYATAQITLSSGAGSSASFANGNLEFLGYAAGAGTLYPGSLTYNVSGTGVSSPATSTTVAIGTGTGGQVGAWGGPIGSSTWVSFDNSQPGSGIIPDNGDYVYETTFNTSSLSGALSGTLAILADDTVSVFLNGTLAGSPGSGGDEDEIATPVGADGHCSAGVPSCSGSTGTLVTLSNILSGTNTLYFVVEQTGLDAEGLDFVGAINGTVGVTATPEPSTLLMFGTGLLGSAGALFRRMRK